MINGPEHRLTVEYLPLEALCLDPRNPRQHSDRQVKQLARSIAAFRFNVPILVDRSNTVLAGHGRVLAARKLGLKSVPTIRLEDLTEAEARAFALADNRLQEQSAWDDQLLGAVLKDLAALDLDFQLEDTGFSMGEIDLRIEGLSAKDTDGQDPDDDPALAQVGTSPVSKVGDLWLLGERHRIHCADALESTSYSSLMREQLAHMVFTDAPYNVRIRGHVSGKGEICHREFVQGSGEMTEGQFTHFLASSMHLLARHSVDGSLHYHCMDFRHMLEILTAGKQAYTELKNLCVWVKSNGGMGALYRSQHELVFLFKSGNGRHRNNVELGQHGRNRTNVWQYAGGSSGGRHTDEGNLLALHPTVKPVALVADAILDCTARGEIVLDPFLGSGSTLIAAERVGRCCYGIELDPLYVDTAVRRWQRHTGDAAIHLQSGKRFDELAAAA